MKIAILYQLHEPPKVGNIRKPMKKGGYSDSGADIAFELKQNGYDVVLPVKNPQEENNFDWVFSDDDNGIKQAMNQGGGRALA